MQVMSGDVQVLRCRSGQAHYSIAARICSSGIVANVVA
jgi:hypothetical protein